MRWSRRGVFHEPLHTGLYTVGPPPRLTARPTPLIPGSDLAFSVRFGPVLHTGLVPPETVPPARVVRPVLPEPGATLATLLFSQRRDPPVWSTRLRFDGALRGQWRIEDTTLEQYELYRGVGASPDFTAAPWETSPTLPFAKALPVSTDNRLTVRYRNRHNLVSQNADETVFVLDGAGALAATAPAAPHLVICEAAADGDVRVQAFYNHAADGSNAADAWLIYQTSDGSDPDPAVDTPTEVAMAVAGSLVLLDRTAGGYADGLTIKTLVRTRRSGTPDVDSTNTTPSSVTSNTDGPTLGAVALHFRSAADQVQ